MVAISNIIVFPLKYFLEKVPTTASDKTESVQLYLHTQKLETTSHPLANSFFAFILVVSSH